MNLYIPVYKKIKYINSILVERSLVTKGEVVAKKGAKVVPFTKIGHSQVSLVSEKLDPKLKIDSGKDDGILIYEGERVGKLGFSSYKAPYNGYISKEGDSKGGATYVFNQEKKDVWLLSGVWGHVEDVYGGNTVSIRTQVIEINFVAYSPQFIMGELIVFPNPDQLLDVEYLRNFSNSIEGKIIYLGHHIRKEAYDTALELNVGGLIAGSITRELYKYSKSQKVPIAVTTGFGNLSTPKHIFDFLKTISNRHVFLDGRRGILQVPVPLDNPFKEESSGSTLRLVSKGLVVLIFDKMHFGRTGEVVDIQNDVIHVKLNKSEDVIQTKVPNIFALI